MEYKIEEVLQLDNIQLFRQFDAENLPNIYLAKKNEVSYLFNIDTKKTIYEFGSHNVTHETSDMLGPNNTYYYYYQYPYLFYVDYQSKDYYYTNYIKYNEIEDKFEKISNFPIDRSYSNYSIIDDKIIFYCMMHYSSENVSFLNKNVCRKDSSQNSQYKLKMVNHKIDYGLTFDHCKGNYGLGGSNIDKISESNVNIYELSTGKHLGNYDHTFLINIEKNLLLLMNNTQYIIYNIETLSEMFRYENQMINKEINVAIQLNNMNIIVCERKENKYNTKVFKIVDVEDENKCHICKKYTDRKTALIPCLCTKYCDNCLQTLTVCEICKESVIKFGKIN
jgi:hypothetical protein